jgi:hypothetical protein
VKGGVNGTGEIKVLLLITRLKDIWRGKEVLDHQGVVEDSGQVRQHPSEAVEQNLGGGGACVTGDTRDE